MQGQEKEIEETKHQEQDATTQSWMKDLWPCIDSALGESYNPTLKPFQTVWVIDEALDGSPTVYQGIAKKTKPAWTVDDSKKNFCTHVSVPKFHKQLVTAIPFLTIIL